MALVEFVCNRNCLLVSHRCSRTDSSLGLVTLNLFLLVRIPLCTLACAGPYEGMLLLHITVTQCGPSKVSDRYNRSPTDKNAQCVDWLRCQGARDRMMWQGGRASARNTSAARIAAWESATAKDIYSSVSIYWPCCFQCRMTPSKHNDLSRKISRLHLLGRASGHFNVYPPSINKCTFPRKKIIINLPEEIFLE